ncbi:hypothetical protein [Burkholderia ubonensis]|uniref:hypothetical protein n=1 Tax=Burkholderia ubonensis TaxID=101571 RepID=UPI0012FA54E3|nr:hypothetical protein [Burkholderia ubonensis]
MTIVDRRGRATHLTNGEKFTDSLLWNLTELFAELELASNAFKFTVMGEFGYFLDFFKKIRELRRAPGSDQKWTGLLFSAGAGPPAVTTGRSWLTWSRYVYVLPGHSVAERRKWRLSVFA